MVLTNKIVFRCRFLPQTLLGSLQECVYAFVTQEAAEINYVRKAYASNIELMHVLTSQDVALLDNAFLEDDLFLPGLSEISTLMIIA